jgi:hypothetical protein
MTLAPFGILNNEQKGLLTDLYAPMYEWPDTQAAFRTLLDGWLKEVAEAIWPVWTGTRWEGSAAKTMEDATRRELELAIRLYHGGGDAPDILAEVPEIPDAPDGRRRNHQWHYEVEDARVHDEKFAYLELPDGEEPSYEFRTSKTIGSNCLLYEPGTDIERFEKLFWGRMRGLQPPLYDIKQLFQRPRPWTAAAALGCGKKFRWITATGIIHTGVHPSILSGHCVQGILGGCAVFDALLDAIEETGEGLSNPRIRGIQKYMVDWGDRRVFAGVHYMTDNIASWTLARRLIPHLFRNARQVENFAVQAITRHSKVFADILEHFHPSDSARAMLLRDFPEAKATS